MNRSNLLPKLLPWVHKGGFTILDQGLISGSNFLISVLLARWLMPEQYGAYAVAFGLFVLLSLVYQSLVLEPMAVFGGSTYRNNLRGYFRSLIWMQCTLSLGIFLVFGASSVATRAIGQSVGLPGALAGVTVASPCVLFFWLVRRAFYLELSPKQAAIGASLYSTLALGGLWTCFSRKMLSPFTAFLIMGLSALATSSLLLVRLRANLPQGTARPPSWVIWRQHWGYGGWALASCVAGWIPAYIYYPLLSTFGSIAQSGQLKALMNLTLPLEQTKAALSMLLLPYVAGVHELKGSSSAKLMSTRLTVIGIVTALAYWVVILLFERPVFHFLYSGRYMEVVHLLPLVALGSIFWSATLGPGIALRAMKSPSSIFTAYAFATVLSLVIGVPATWAFGLTGGIWGSNIADFASVAAVVFMLHRRLSNPAVQQV